MNLTQDFPLTADTIGDIYLHTHPLLIERNGDIDHYRIAAADVDYIELIIDNRTVSVIPNYYREEPVMHYSRMSGIYTVCLDFFPGDHIHRSLLYGDPLIRIHFWRPPVTPVWITHNAEACFGSLSKITRAYNGSTWEYRWGSLLPY